MEIKIPCYCDTPDKDDQITIQKRCRVRMYFDAVASLTKEQVIKIENTTKLSQFPIGDCNECLCKLCQFLEEEQMKNISVFYYNIEWPHKTLYDWYVQHLKDDKDNN